MSAGATNNPISEAAELREQFARLREANLRINESLDLDTVLQDVLDSARSLSSARYGVLAVLRDDGEVDALLSSGLGADELGRLQETPGGWGLYRYLERLTEPLRVSDLGQFARSVGLREFAPPFPVLAFLAVPIRRLGSVMGYLYVAHSEPDREFSADDEETLVIFAAHAALVVSDVRRHRDAALARNRLEALADSSPVGVQIFDATTGNPVYSNREAMRIAHDLGGSDQSPAEGLRNLSIRRADASGSAAAGLSLAKLMNAGETLRTEEIALVAPDGRTSHALLSATPIRARDVRRNESGSDGRDLDGDDVESYVITLQDLTKLEQIGRLRAEFLDLVNDRLRMPLAAVKGAVMTMLESGDTMSPAETQQFHRIIRDHADSMRRLIVDLLDLARIETGALVVSAEPAGVAELVEDARRRFLDNVGHSRVGVELALATDLPPVMADDWRMAQALAHLFAHIAARMPIGASLIHVGAVREGLNVAFTVAAEESAGGTQDLLRGVRGALTVGTGEEAANDAGLGLAVCQGIVEAHGGRLRAEIDGSRPGAQFVITIPAAQWQPAGAATAAPEQANGAPQDRLRVLAVEDDPQARRHLNDALSNAGYFPITAEHAEDALRLIASERPQVVLLDAAMPAAGGSLGEQLRNIMVAVDVPVILLTAPGQEEAMAHALELGVSDYLVRPFSSSELTARINTALRRHVEPHLAARTETYALGDLTIDFAQRRVSLAGSPVALSPHEYGLLAELAMNAGRTLTHDQLLQRVWSPGRIGQRWLLREVVKRLRGKLGDDAADPASIFLQRGVGYRMGPDVVEA